MPVLQAGGIGSGLDVANLVNQLVAAERVPAEGRLNRRKTQIDNVVSALGLIKSSLSTLQTKLADLKTSTAFQQRKATATDPTVATATATSASALGTYNLSVTTLAESHKLRTGFGVADTTATSVGTGTLHISVGGGAVSDVAIATGTLDDVRNSINNAGLGISAVIVNDGTNNFLSLSSDTTGVAGSINITVTDTGDGNNTDANGLSRLAFDVGVTENLTQTTAATDASFILDGVTITSSSNTVNTAISGVTFELLKAGSTTDITIGADTAATKDTVKQFVETYNVLISTLNSQSRYSAGADSQGPLLSDSMVSSLRSSLQGMMGGLSSNGGVYTTLTELGYATDTTNGTFVLKNEADLDTALANNFDDVGLIFADVATNVDAFINPYLGTTGVLDQRTDGLNDQLEDIEDQRLRLEDRIESITKRYTRQFSALDGLIASMNSTMSFLSQQLGSLPGARSAN